MVDIRIWSRSATAAHDAWVVYFSFKNGSDSGCAVIVPDASQLKKSLESCTAIVPA
jgi:hypothetical protein